MDAMSEETFDFPRRVRRVQAITGALAAIPTASPDAPSLLRDPEQLTDRSFSNLGDDEKLGLFQALRQQLIDQQQRYLSLLKISSALGATLDRSEFLEITLEHITDVMRAERSSLFLVDHRTGELHGKIAQGSTADIVLMPGQGIAGWVASTGQSINIRDVYDDPRFHAAVDNRTGFQTRSMLCQPLRNADGKILAVLQVLNSQNVHFTEEDENLLSAIGGQISIALENSDLYQSLVGKNQELRRTAERLEYKIAELDLLYDIQSHLSQPSDLVSLVETITRKTLELVNGKACALTLRENNFHRVHVMIDHSPDYSRNWNFYTRLIQPENTIARTVIQNGKPFICHDGACRYIPGPSDDDAGMNVDNVIAVPLFDDDECIGALQVFNLALPQDPTRLGFTDDDVKVLTLIASQIASTVASRRRRDEKEKEDRLATIGQMIAGILHDFKTPFSVISGYVQLLADTDEGERRHEYADRVLNQIRELNQMTREMLKFARGDSRILLRRVLINAFMDDVRELLETEFSDRNIELTMDIAYRGEAHMDPVKIKRAILNLARNASDAMPEGGTVRLHVDRIEDRLRILFEDSGQGIPLDIRDHLFESFVTRGKAEGTGLGLAVVKKIVEDHCGTITFESTLDKGTTFFIDLPISPPENCP